MRCAATGTPQTDRRVTIFRSRKTVLAFGHYPGRLISRALRNRFSSRSPYAARAARGGKADFRLATRTPRRQKKTARDHSGAGAHTSRMVGREGRSSEAYQLTQFRKGTQGEAGQAGLLRVDCKGGLRGWSARLPGRSLSDWLRPGPLPARVIHLSPANPCRPVRRPHEKRWVECDALSLSVLCLS